MAEEFRTPQSANEALLQNILGAENDIREPQSVTEYYLKKIWEEGTGGGDLYMHNLKFNRGNPDVNFLIINRSETPFELNTFYDYLIENGMTHCGKMIPATGGYVSNGRFNVALGIYAANDMLYIYGIGYNDGVISHDTIYIKKSWSDNFGDTVIKI